MVQLHSNPELTTRTGLSVLVRGSLLSVVADDATKVARVMVMGGVFDEPGIGCAARLLSARARRYLGSDWTVVEYGRN